MDYFYLRWPKNIKMIDYIKGKIAFKNPAFIIVETGGLGYRVNISLNTYAQIEKLEEVKILTSLQIREDSHTLYGFADEAERKLFNLLLSVSGIGATTAQVVLSSMNPEEVKSAIISDNDLAFKKVKGIGPKTAKRLIIDLKDKIMKDGGGDISITMSAQDNTMRQEALSALVALGFNRIHIQKALNKALKADKGIQDVEHLIKVTLKLLSK